MSALPEPGQLTMRRWRVLFILAIASSLTSLSVDFFAPSMPSATRGLGASAEAVKATMFLFLIGYAVGPFVWGSLADRIGRRPVMLIGLGCYVSASIGCLLAPGITELSLLRVVQGFGAASGAVIARAVLRDVYGPAGATQAISGMFLIMVWVPVTAPVLGGLVSALFDWRASFLVMAMVAGTTLVGAWLCLVETQPANLHSGLPEPAGWTSVLTHTTFLSHALANMFCVATLLIFLSNYSYLTEALYGLSARQNGYVLAGFNASIATGVYFVRFCVPRIGVEKSIRTGLWMACAGWILLATISPQAEHNPVFMLPCLAAACLGTGMVLTLTVGQALVPFTHAAATASALFIFMQSAGASTITHLATAFVDVTLLHLAVILSICALLALIISRLLGTMGGVSSNGTAHD